MHMKINSPNESYFCRCLWHAFSTLNRLFEMVIAAKEFFSSFFNIPYEIYLKAKQSAFMDMLNFKISKINTRKSKAVLCSLANSYLCVSKISVSLDWQGWEEQRGLVFHRSFGKVTSKSILFPILSIPFNMWISQIWSMSLIFI